MGYANHQMMIYPRDTGYANHQFLDRYSDQPKIGIHATESAKRTAAAVP